VNECSRFSLAKNGNVEKKRINTEKKLAMVVLHNK